MDVTKLAAPIAIISEMDSRNGTKYREF